MVNLRSYQTDLVESIRSAFRQGVTRCLAVAPTGSGKTVVFSYIAQQSLSRGSRTLILVHRQELLDQTSRTLTAFDVPHGVIAAGRSADATQRIQIASVQTLVRRLHKTPTPDLIVIDECFTGDTLIDGVPICKRKIGDVINTHKGKGKVTHLFKNPCGEIYVLNFSNGQKIKCTANHPIYTKRGFIEASRLTVGDMMVSIIPYEKQMRDMRNASKEETLWCEGVQIRVFKGNYCKHIQKEWWANNAIQENQRNARSCNQSKSFNQIASNGLETSKAGRQRETISNSTDCTSIVSRLGNGISGRHKNAAIKWVSKLLQIGYWRAKFESWNRGGWKFSQCECKKDSRQKKGGFFKFTRLDSIEIYKSGSGNEFAKLCPDGFVYNLEVENGNTYFANGILVHNCHHAVAGSWKSVIDAYPSARVLGVTATPERLDGKGLRSVFDQMILGPKVSDLQRDGHLSLAKYYAPTTADLSGVKSRMGDYDKNGLESVINRPTVTGDAVDHYARLAHGMPAIAFCVSVAHARNVAESFCRAGYDAATLDGTLSADVRRERVQMLGDGRLSVLTSCEIVNEGFDVPVVGAAILLRPTQSLGLHLQQIGRVLRPAPGKTHAVILDHAGNLARHGLAEDERDWSLGDRPKRQKGSGEATPPVRQCPECYCCHAPNVSACPECGHEYDVEGREIEQVDGELVEFGLTRRIEVGQARTYQDLVEIGNTRKYKPGWARIVWEKRKNKYK